MDAFKGLVIILLSSVLVDNYVLTRFLGICPFLGVSKKLDSAVGMGIAVTFVMVLATAVTWPIQMFILGEKYAYLQTIVFILVIASLVQFIEMALKKFIPSLHKALGVYLPLITTNCAVLGVTLNNLTETNIAGNTYNFLEAMVNSLGVGIGFLLAMVLFSGMRSKIQESEIPESFKGLPATLIAASFISLAFFGFGGIVENLFS
ncbi:MAG: RnfABCDGE type electron transport complex subunit A [Clostridia bacterium]|nr:RnfABCDGE type electron transport complex subunit A [Clostridia bacterium]